MTQQTAGTAKPRPRIDAVSGPFWEGCNEERLVVQRCEGAGCGRYVYYPRVCCPHCHGARLAWCEVSGAGHVVTHTTVHRPHHPGFYTDAPYVFAAIALKEGPLVYATLLEAPTGARLIGRAVHAAFVRHAPDQKMLAFRLTDRT